MQPANDAIPGLGAAEIYDAIFAVDASADFLFKQKTAYEIRPRDWSSECALPIWLGDGDRSPRRRRHLQSGRQIDRPHRSARSEERRVGKECRSRWSPYH